MSVRTVEDRMDRVEENMENRMRPEQMAAYVRRPDFRCPEKEYVVYA